MANSYKRNDLSETITLKAFGVDINIFHDIPEKKEKLLQGINQAIPTNLEIKSGKETGHNFEIRSDKSNNFSLLKDGEDLVIKVNFEQLIDRLETHLRLTVGEYADDRVFVHAGVVSWRNEAIIIPAKSFKGKTSLVVELVKRGAVYYSDEYAVIDSEGYVHPFPKTLSVRGIIDEYTQLERDVGFYGGNKGKEAIKPGLILVTQYKKHSKFRPKRLTQGEVVLELISNTLPIRRNPEFSLKSLNKLADNSIAIETKRGEARRFSKKLLEWFDEAKKN